MPSAVKLSDEIVKDARREAKLMKRSIAGQVEYWAQLGRTIESSGLFSVEQVRAVLSGEGSVQNLTPAEDAIERLRLSALRRTQCLLVFPALPALHAEGLRAAKGDEL